MDTELRERPVDEALKAVAAPTRREILRLLRDRELPAGRIAERFPAMSRPAVSQHLRVLEVAGLVSVCAEGNRRLYRSRREGLRDVAGFIDEMWSDQLSRLKIAAEHEHQRRGVFEPRSGSEERS